MGNKKISELPVTATLTDNDIIPVVNSDGTKKATVDTLQNKVKTKYNIPNDVNSALSAKADRSTTYTKTEVDTALTTKQPKTDSSLASLDAQGRVVQSILAVDEHEQQDRVAIDNRIKKFYTSNLLAENVSDSDDGVIRNLKLYGKGSQASYSGKNLLNSTLQTRTTNGVTCTRNADGTYTLNGTATAAATFTLTSQFPIVAGTTYRLTGCPSGGDWTKYSVRLNGYANADLGHGLTYVASSTENVNSFIYVDNGATVNNLVFKPMICTDTTATYANYEPYVGGIPSPNPSYPQTIHSVVNLKMVACGKNLINGTMRGGNAENSSGSTDIRMSNTGRVYVKAGTTYTLSANETTYRLNYSVYTTPTDPAIRAERVDDLYWLDFTNGKINITPNASGYIAFAFKKSDGSTITQAERDAFKMQVEVGSTATSYEPYEGNTATLSKTLNAIPVSSGGNVTIDGQQYVADYVDVERKKIVRMCKKIDFTTVEPVTYQNALTNSREARYDNGTLGIKAKLGTIAVGNGDGFITASHRNSTSSTWGVDSVGIWQHGQGSNGEYLVLRVPKDSSAPAYFRNIGGCDGLFEIDTPIDETLTDAEIADFLAMRSYYPQTNYSLTSDDLSSKAEFIYPCSIENFVEYVKVQQGDTRTFIYNIDDVADRAYIDSQYALALIELS